MKHFVVTHLKNQKSTQIVDETQVEYFNTHPSVRGKYSITPATSSQVKQAGKEDDLEPVEIKPSRKKE